MVSFTVPKFLSIIRSCSLIFAFICITLGDRSKKIPLWFTSKSILPMFSSRSSILSSLPFKSLIHVEFVVEYSVIEGSNYILCHGADQFSQCHLWRRLSFLYCIFLFFFFFTVLLKLRRSRLSFGQILLVVFFFKIIFRIKSKVTVI